MILIGCSEDVIIVLEADEIEVDHEWNENKAQTKKQNKWRC